MGHVCCLQRPAHRLLSFKRLCIVTLQKVNIETRVCHFKFCKITFIYISPRRLKGFSIGMRATENMGFFLFFFFFGGGGVYIKDMACENDKIDRGVNVWGRKNALGKETQTEYKSAAGIA